MPNKRKIIIVLAVVVVILILQLFRIGMLVKWNELTMRVDNSYDLKNAKVLSADDLKGFSKKKYLCIASGDEEVDAVYRQLFNYIKLDVEIISASKSITSEEIKAYDMIMVNATEWSKVSSLNAIIDYVKEGGKVILTLSNGTASDKSYSLHASKLGIVEFRGYEQIKGFEFKTPLVTGLNVLTAEEVKSELFFWTTPTHLTKKARVHMVNEKGNPMLWDIRYGKGTIGVYNCFPADYEFRKALYLGLMGQIDSNFVYPIINAQVLFIDDFPGKYEGNNEKIQKKYSRSMKRYFSEIWWPDIVSTMQEYGVVYTGAFITNQNNNVEGKFAGENLISKKDLLHYGREIIKNGGEISFQGYNHQPIIYDQAVASRYGYKAWPSETLASEAVKVAKAHFNAVFPNYNWKTYMPPANVFNLNDRAAIESVLPEIEVYSGVLFSDNGAVLAQDYSVTEDGIVQLPRVSSGNVIYAEELIPIYSVASVNGIINHLINPDTFMDDSKSHGLSWEELFGYYDSFLDNINNNYSWLDKTTAYQAGQKVKQYYYCDIYTKTDGNKLYIACDNFVNEQALILFNDKAVTAHSGCEVSKLAANKYLVKMKQQIAVVEVK